MPLSTAETIGFANQFVQLIEDNKELLQEKGLDVSTWITEIKTLNSSAISKDAILDDARAAMKIKTTEAADATKLVYKTSSTRLDAVIGVLGKDTPLAKQVARLRSDLIKQSKKRTDSGNSSNKT